MSQRNVKSEKSVSDPSVSGRSGMESIKSISNQVTQTDGRTSQMSPSQSGGSQAGSSQASSRSATQRSQSSTMSQKTQMSQSQSISTGGGAKSSAGGKPGKVKGSGKKITIVRHSERMDRVFNSWIANAFGTGGEYRPYDLNQPLKLADRRGGHMSWMIDPPLTEMGRMTAMMMGRGLKKHGFRCTYVYASPSFRCVETANEIMKGMSQQVPIRIEPGLFEWVGWYKDGEPEWLQPQEYAAMGWFIDQEYSPMMSDSAILNAKGESLEELYERMNRIVVSIAEASGADDSVLIVAHGVTCDGANRRLRGLPLSPPLNKDLIRMGLYYPYLCLLQVEELENGSWRIVDNPAPPLSMLEVSNRVEASFYNR